MLEEIFHNRYRILSILGKGGMGTVYLSEDLRLKGKQWAIKEIIVKQSDYQLFIDEAKMLVALNHPYLPNIVDYYPPDDEGYSYLVMDYIKGQTLMSIFEAAGENLSYRKILKYAIQICELFDYLHNQQNTPIIYRDLKPANVMIDEQDNVRLIDFGIARNYKEGKVLDTEPLGTVGFAAPEQFENKQTDQRTDIYSLGALIYFLLSGGKYYYNIQKPLSHFREDLPHDLVWILKRMLMLDPDKRYQNIREVKKELERVVSNGLGITEEITIARKNLENLKSTNYEETELIYEERNKVPVYQEVYTNLPPKLIIVANLSKRAGSTFLTLNLAKFMSDLNILISVIEPPLEPYIFDYIGLEQRLNKIYDEESIDFYSFPHIINENKKIEREKETIEDGVIWMVADPRKPLIVKEKWTENHMTKFIYSSRKANITFVDVGGFIDHKSIQPLLNDADLILILVDPMPSEIMLNYQKLDKFIDDKKKGLPIEFVVNRWTKGIKKNEIKHVLGVNPITYIPAIDLTYIHKAVYECNIPYTYPEIKSDLEEQLHTITKKILPSEHWNLLDNSKIATGTWFNKWLKRR